ncbi:MAG: hypothetical protein ACR2LF_12820 [Jatrophihabitantaceae bacterium]
MTASVIGQQARTTSTLGHAVMRAVIRGGTRWHPLASVGLLPEPTSLKVTASCRSAV